LSTDPVYHATRTAPHRARLHFPITGLTISDPDYHGDYGMPQWGDYAIVQAKDGADVPELVTAGLFDEHWQIRK
jgi:hypothetical protein